MLDVITLVLPFFGLIFIGVLAARLFKLPVDALGWMNIFIVYFALPALLFRLVSETPVEQLGNWGFISGAILSTYVVFAIMFFGSVIWSRGEIAESTIKGLAAAYGNIGYMGPGLALLTFGEEAAVPVALIFCVENTLHFTIAPLLMALSGKSRLPPHRLAGQILRKIVLHPFIIAIMLGIAAAAAEISPPEVVDRFLTALSEAAAPCALFAMGVTLALSPLRRLPVALAPITLLKLVVHPMVYYVMLSWIGDFDPVWVYTAILLAALPTATNVFVIAQQYGVWVERASASILVTTVTSVITLTAILFVIKSGVLPPDLFAQ